MHIGAVLVFAPRSGGAPAPRRCAGASRCGSTRSRASAAPLAARTSAVPRSRTGSRTPAFDLDHHVRRAALPAPGGPAELLDWAGDFYSHRLDRARPLWELVILEGLAGGRWALAPRPTTRWSTASARSTPAASCSTRGDDDRSWGSPGDGAPQHGTVAGTALGAVHAVPHPVETAQRSLALADLVVRDEIVAAPRTSLTAPLGKHRRLATVEVSLEQVKAISARSAARSTTCSSPP